MGNWFFFYFLFFVSLNAFSEASSSARQGTKQDQIAVQVIGGIANPLLMIKPSCDKGCNTNSECSHFIRDVKEDGNQNRFFGALKSSENFCRMNLEKATNTEKFLSQDEAMDVFHKSYSYLGANHQLQLRTCSSFTGNQTEIASKQYYYLSKLEKTQSLVAKQMLAIDQALGVRSFAPDGCGQFVYPSSLEVCQGARACQNKGNTLDQLVEKTKVVGEQILKIDNQIFDIKAQLSSHSGNLDAEARQAFANQIVQLESTKALLKEEIPWMPGGYMQQNTGPHSGTQKSLKQIVEANLRENRKQLSEVIQETNKIAKCMETTYGSCDKDDTRIFLEALPESDHSFNGKKGSSEDDKRKLRALGVMQSYERCSLQVQADQIKTAKVLKSLTVDVGLILVGGIPGLVERAVAKVGTEAFATSVIKSLPSVGGTVSASNAVANLKGIYESCLGNESSKPKLKDTQNSSCTTSDLYSFSQEKKDFIMCAAAIGTASAAGVVAKIGKVVNPREVPPPATKTGAAADGATIHAAEVAANFARPVPKYVENVMPGINKYEPTTVAENTAFIELTKKSSGIEQQVIHDENAFLKEMNAMQGVGSTAATEITNLRLAIVHKKMAELAAQFPQLKMNKYSSYKDYSVLFTGKKPADFDKILAQKFKEIDLDFELAMHKFYPKETKIILEKLAKKNIKSVGQINDIFKTGVVYDCKPHICADEAASAARNARQGEVSEVRKIVNFDGPQVQIRMDRTLDEAQNLQTKLDHELPKVLFGSGGEIDNYALDIVKKNKDNPAAALEQLRIAYKLKSNELDLQKVEDMIAYMKRVDEISPPVRSPIRGEISCEDNSGCLGTDLLGLGSQNISGLMKAIRRLPPATEVHEAKIARVKEAITEARKAEVEVTKVFLKQQEKAEADIVKAMNPRRKYLPGRTDVPMGKARSGDDFVASIARDYKTHEAQNIVENLAQGGNQIRAAVAAKELSKKVQSDQVNYGHQFIKDLVEELRFKYPKDVIQSLSYLAIMPKEGATGTIRLLRGYGNRSQAFSKTQKDEIKAAAERAFAKMKSGKYEVGGVKPNYTFEFNP